jgi:Rieske Fe-S protein
MSNECKVDCGRRRLVVATAAVGGVGALAALVPFVSSMLPSERAKAAGAPVEVDIGTLEPGQMMTVEWRGKPVWIINRTPHMLETLPKLDDAMADPKSEKNMQPEYCRNETRSIKPPSHGRGGYLYPPRLLALGQVQARCRRRHGRQLAGRFPVPLPWLDLRLRRTGLTRASRHRTTCRCRRTCTCPRRAFSSVKTRRGLKHGIEHRFRKIQV